MLSRRSLRESPPQFIHPPGTFDGIWTSTKTTGFTVPPRLALYSPLRSTFPLLAKYVPLRTPPRNVLRRRPSTTTRQGNIYPLSSPKHQIQQ